MLDQRRRRWADVVQMLYKCCLLTGKLTEIPFLYFLNKSDNCQKLYDLHEYAVFKQLQ